MQCAVYTNQLARSQPPPSLHGQTSSLGQTLSMTPVFCPAWSVFDQHPTDMFSLCDLVLLSLYPLGYMSSCRYFPLSFFPIVIRSSCPYILLLCLLILRSFCPYVFLFSCPIALISSFPAGCILFCPYVLLSLCPLIVMSTCPYGEGGWFRSTLKLALVVSNHSL